MLINKRLLKNIFKLLLQPVIAATGKGKNLYPNKDFWQLIYTNFPPGTNFRFIQVGANDGVNFDILYNLVTERESSGIVIEPLKDFYKKLCFNYSNYPHVIKVNKAVHPTDTTVTMYRVDPLRQHELQSWTSGIASLDPHHHKKSNTHNNYIIQEQVEALPLMEIVEKYSPVKHFDLLQIDVEGFDYEILKMIDFNKLRPAILKYEFANLKQDEKTNSKRLLRKNGYYLFENDVDVIGVLLDKIRL